MRLTKDIVKREIVFDREQVKVGDKLTIFDDVYNENTVAEVLDVEDDEIKVMINGKIDFYSVDEVKNLRIEKVEENKLSKFKIGDRYKVEDINSSDTYYAVVMDITDKEMCLKRDSGKFTVVTDSQIGKVYKFTKVTSDNKKKNEPTKEEYEERLNEYAERVMQKLKEYGINAKVEYLDDRLKQSYCRKYL